MNETTGRHEGGEGSEFESLASRARPTAFAEFLHFLAHNKKWWLTPVIIALLLLGVFVLLGSTAAAPFIYTLF